LNVIIKLLVVESYAQRPRRCIAHMPVVCASSVICRGRVLGPRKISHLCPSSRPFWACFGRDNQIARRRVLRPTASPLHCTHARGVCGLCDMPGQGLGPQEDTAPLPTWPARCTSEGYCAKRAPSADGPQSPHRCIIAYDARVRHMRSRLQGAGCATLGRSCVLAAPIRDSCPV
jgi:hypothetical protein